MIEVVGVKIKPNSKMQYFKTNNLIIKKNTDVIVKTIRGVEYGTVVLENMKIPKEELKNEEPIIRIATKEDQKKQLKNKQKEKDAYGIFLKIMERNDLEMKLIDIDLIFDLNKIIFYFVADGRIDFRNFVKDLAAIFKMRIELRQIGVRDKARHLNGIGICGRTLCCATFLDNFQSVSIKMAKDQNLSLNPAKISGVCGRLMCCLKYEQDTYEELSEGFPKEGDIIATSSGVGEVLMVDVLRQIIKAAVKKDETDTTCVEFFSSGEVSIIKRAEVNEINEKVIEEDLKGLED